MSSRIRFKLSPQGIIVPVLCILGLVSIVLPGASHSEQGRAAEQDIFSQDNGIQLSFKNLDLQMNRAPRDGIFPAGQDFNEALADMKTEGITPVILGTAVADKSLLRNKMLLKFSAMETLPPPGRMMATGPAFTPVYVKGLTIYPDNPFQFDFIINPGDAKLSDEAFRRESANLMKYFLASLAVPDEERWVNLSPFEQDRVIPDSFGSTVMGRDVLIQDYILKQLLASLMNPDTPSGEQFWKRIHTKAAARYGTAEIPVSTFHKIWILPDHAEVYEHHDGKSVFLLGQHLKVMLEADYMAAARHRDHLHPEDGALTSSPGKEMDDISAQIVRDVLIPELEREVNEGRNFANLRQIYDSMILATWYKKRLRESLLGRIYVDQKKTRGIDVKDPAIKEQIYQQYLKVFRQGVFNFIREDYDPTTQAMVPRKYFAGGLMVTVPESVLKLSVALPPDGLPPHMTRPGDVVATWQTRFSKKDMTAPDTRISVDRTGAHAPEPTPALQLMNPAKMIGQVPHKEPGGVNEAIKTALTNRAATALEPVYLEGLIAFLDRPEVTKILTSLKMDVGALKNMLNSGPLKFYLVYDVHRRSPFLLWKDRENFQAAHVGMERSLVYLGQVFTDLWKTDRDLANILLLRETLVWYAGFSLLQQKLEYDQAVDQAEQFAERIEKKLSQAAGKTPSALDDALNMAAQRFEKDAGFVNALPKKIAARLDEVRLLVDQDTVQVEQKLSAKVRSLPQEQQEALMRQLLADFQAASMPQVLTIPALDGRTIFVFSSGRMVFADGEAIDHAYDIRIAHIEATLAAAQRKQAQGFDPGIMRHWDTAVRNLTLAPFYGFSVETLPRFLHGSYLINMGVYSRRPDPDTLAPDAVKLVSLTSVMMFPFLTPEGYASAHFINQEGQMFVFDHEDPDDKTTPLVERWTDMKPEHLSRFHQTISAAGRVDPELFQQWALIYDRFRRRHVPDFLPDAFEVPQGSQTLQVLGTDGTIDLDRFGRRVIGTFPDANSAAQALVSLVQILQRRPEIKGRLMIRDAAEDLTSKTVIVQDLDDFYESNARSLIDDIPFEDELFLQKLLSQMSVLDMGRQAEAPGTTYLLTVEEEEDGLLLKLVLVPPDKQIDLTKRVAEEHEITNYSMARLAEELYTGARYDLERRQEGGQDLDPAERKFLAALTAVDETGEQGSGRSVKEAQDPGRTFLYVAAPFSPTQDFHAATEDTFRMTLTEENTLIAYTRYGVFVVARHDSAGDFDLADGEIRANGFEEGKDGPFSVRQDPYTMERVSPETVMPRLDAPAANRLIAAGYLTGQGQFIDLNREGDGVTQTARRKSLEQGIVMDGQTYRVVFDQDGFLAEILLSGEDGQTVREIFIKGVYQRVETLVKAPPGGIDLASGHLNLKVRRDHMGVPLPWKQQPVKIFDIDGAVPVILNIQPFNTFHFLLSFDTEPSLVMTPGGL